MGSSRRTISLAGLLGIGLLLSACSKKPTEEECEAFADHFIKLLEESRENPDARIRKLANNQRQSLINTCVQEGTKKEIDCVMAQSSIGDVEKNCK